jgi:hypothetical protein
VAGTARKDLDFDKRRLVTLEPSKHHDQNKDLRSPGRVPQQPSGVAADPARTRDYLMRVSMIERSLRSAGRNWGSPMRRAPSGG